MALSVGIVGLPNVGKSTLFKAVTNKQVDIQNYPFTTIEPNVGVVEVPDERIDQLTEFSKSAKKLYATVEFIDIAGLVKGASQGEGLGNKFLANIREVDAIAHVVRVHDTSDVLHVHGTIDPVNDIGVINAELIVADLDNVVKRLEGAKHKVHHDPDAKASVPLLERLADGLQRGMMASAVDMHHDDEQRLLKEMNLLTAKPFIYVFNVSEAQLTENWQPDAALLEALAGAHWVVMCNKMELELSEMPHDEKTAFLAELGLPESGLDRLITVAYDTLGLHSFLTTGPKESRAWTCHKGDTIPVAARAIHTDFERLFIRAEVINWKTLLESGSHANARAHGLIHTVGKDYVVKDGDVVEILIGK
ncbi:MAG TPA: redox-regulated ATPase YchF [Candidatus Paceibacterota bacterium]|nr:redox-regulated ATPase YchF [Candidatus Paceibacterota bacterium]